MTSHNTRIRRLFLVCITVTMLGTSTGAGPASSSTASDPPLTDSLYTAHHPRLLVIPAEMTILYDKVRDGGDDDAAYAVIRNAATTVYPFATMEELLDDDYGLNPVVNVGLAGLLESPPDTAAFSIGRKIALHIADNYEVDFDPFGSSLRLRSLALGYDMFLEHSSEAERDHLRSEMVSYIDRMTNHFNYEIWGYHPYLGNKTTMIAASLGLAAICLDGETDPARVAAALGFADELIGTWAGAQLDEDGAYNEGLVYGAWSLRMLVYYIHARKRYDGVDWGAHPCFRNMETWFAYELLPEGTGRTNNLNDCAYKDYILSRHNTYFDWAQSQYGSGLAAWLWEHTAGQNGYDWGLEADKAATVLWNQPLPPTNPANVLPKSVMWEHRGLYYYRAGWDVGPGSNDLLFSFYAGEFQGAHAQEDQGQFTMYGYGAAFAVDHGPGFVAKQSESHNLVLIDGAGQHNAGSSIGTDGAIREYLLSDYADYIAADLADAYATHSQWNDPDVPFQGADWSWGYHGANPVIHALRKILVVHDNYLPPYFILMDDIDKDGQPHDYDWRMHTSDANAVDVSSNPVRISKGTSRLDIHVFEPPFDSLQASVGSYDNGNEEPDALLLSLLVTQASPRFTLFMFPGDDSVGEPGMTRQDYSWGYAVTVAWGAGSSDVFIRNTSGEQIVHSFGGSIATDAELGIVRLQGNRLLRFVLTDVSNFSYNNTHYIGVSDGPLNCGMSAGVYQIDRPDAQFVLYAANADRVYFRDEEIPVILQDGYLVPESGVVGLDETAPDFAVRAKAWPNPFNPSTSVVVELPRRAGVQAVIFDVGGRLVTTLWNGDLPAGPSTLTWDGTDRDGARVASGVYFLRIVSRAHTLK
jgi:hypothetical protein